MRANGLERCGMRHARCHRGMPGVAARRPRIVTVSAVSNGRVLARSVPPVWTTANASRTRAAADILRNMIRRQPVSATADHAEERTNPAARLGFQPGQVVQEIGYDDDVDQELREAIEEVIGQRTRRRGLRRRRRRRCAVVPRRGRRPDGRAGGRHRVLIDEGGADLAADAEDRP